MGRITRTTAQTINQNIGTKSILVWIAIAVIVVILLIIILKKKQATIDVGNAQFLGAAQLQNDYFACLENDNGVLAVVSDGIGQKHYGRICAEIVVRTYIEQYAKSDPIVDHMLFLRRMLRLANQRVTQTAPSIGCGATVSVAILKDENLYWLNVGNSAIMVAGKEEIIRINETYTDIYFNEPSYKRKPLAYFDRYLGLEDDLKAQSGKIVLTRAQKHVLLCTDGVYMQSSEIDMLKVLKKPISAFEKAHKIVLDIENKHRIDQDNATIIVLERNRN